MSILFLECAQAGSGWTSVGDSVSSSAAYGSKGIPSLSNLPGGRMMCSHWTDSDGNLWLFGGDGRDENGTLGSLSDLWKFDSASMVWIWMGGPSQVNQVGNYGIKGISAPDNWPGARMDGMTWFDEQGKLWLFGGFGYDGDNVPRRGYLNDLWVYDIPTEKWTWVSGTNVINDAGSRGQINVPSPTNLPRSRRAGVTWSTSSTLYLFGGVYSSSSYASTYDDLWVYDKTTQIWTWIKGSTTYDSPPVIGTIGEEGTSVTPGAIYNCAKWQTPNDYVWLYGGTNRFTTPNLWRFSLASGNWMRLRNSSSTMAYGKHGQELPEVSPGLFNESINWMDSEGRLVLMGAENQNNLWRFNFENKNWAWLGGNGMNGAPSYRTGPWVWPGSRKKGVHWQDAQGRFWLFGGINGNTYLNDLWYYDTTASLRVTPLSFNFSGRHLQAINPDQLELINVSGLGTFNCQVSAADSWLEINPANVSVGDHPVTQSITVKPEFLTPGTTQTTLTVTCEDERSSATQIPVTVNVAPLSIQASPANFQIVTTLGQSPEGISFTIKHDGESGELPWSLSCPQSWVNLPTVSGTIKSTSTTIPIDFNSISLPEGFHEATIRLDIPIPGYGSYLTTVVLVVGDDSTGSWTWMGGSKALNSEPQYGTKGIASAGNTPGARGAGATWKDAAGNFWLFGGTLAPADLSDFSRQKNDLWKFDGDLMQWAWMGGSTTLNTTGSYGLKGISSAGNWPGSRHNAQTWLDNNGTFWLHGGMGAGASSATKGWLGDLWNFNPTTMEWTWVAGSDAINPGITYGEPGRGSPDNSPGGREGASTWVDPYNNLWMFGGNAYGHRNDLWVYLPLQSQWVWMRGTQLLNNWGVAGEIGTIGPGYNMAARRNAAEWIDPAGQFWCFGGQIWLGSRYMSLNSTWSSGIDYNYWGWMAGENRAQMTTAPIFSRILNGGASANPGGLHSASVLQNQNGEISLFGGSGYNGAMAEGLHNSLWQFDSNTKTWNWVKGNAGVNYPGIYGQQGVSKGGNSPGSRSLAAGWVDSSDNIWIFGGVGFAETTSTLGVLGDLWKYTPPPNSQIDWEEAELY